MLTHVKVRLNQNHMFVRIEDSETGKEVGLVQSVKLIKKDNSYIAIMNRFILDEKNENPTGISSKLKVFKKRVDKKFDSYYIMAKEKIICEAEVDFTAWPEAKGKKKIFVSIAKGSRSQAI